MEVHLHKSINPKYDVVAYKQENLLLVWFGKVFALVKQPPIHTRTLIHWFNCVPRGHIWRRNWDRDVTYCARCDTTLDESSYTFDYGVDALSDRIRLAFKVDLRPFFNAVCWLEGHRFYEMDEEYISCIRCGVCHSTYRKLPWTLGAWLRAKVWSLKRRLIRQRIVDPNDKAPF